MSFPLYIFYELLVRISEIKPEVGSYVSCSNHSGNWHLNTTTGGLYLSEDILNKQFNNPALVTADELRLLATKFRPR